MEPHQQRMSQLEREQRVVCEEGQPRTLADCSVTAFTYDGRAVGFPFIGPTPDVAQPTPPGPPMGQGVSATVRTAAAARQAAFAGGAGSGGGGAGDGASVGKDITGSHAPADHYGVGGGKRSSVSGHGEGRSPTNSDDNGVGKRKRPVHVRPMSAISTYDATPIARRPGVIVEHHQAMHNPGVKPFKPGGAPKTCQKCGHLLVCERYKQIHGGGGYRGGTWTCGVATEDH